MAKSAGDAIAEFLEEVERVDKLHPESDQEELFYRRYRIAYYHKPDGMLPCHLCQQRWPKRTPAYIEENKMKSHCKVRHPKANIMCGYNSNCTVQFNSQADKERHIFYGHTEPYDWWIL